jgi:hypothetical protein
VVVLFVFGSVDWVVVFEGKTETATDFSCDDDDKTEASEGGADGNEAESEVGGGVE